MTSLKSFIKAVRASKTLADERAVIQKESAAIRTSFRDEHTQQSVRRQNVAKLLYLFTLGERTHFGQVECLKLLATTRFSDKRLGYLGAMLLLDENQEVLTLLTNSLSRDLAHSNQYVVALALSALANIASQEMARDLYADVEKILGSTNPYLRKKAALCALRIARRVPELADSFVESAEALLSDKNHGVLLCGASLLRDLCEYNPEEMVPRFRPLIPTVLKTLKGLSGSGYAPEHDVSGIADPFLQQRLLALLRVLAADDSSSAEQMGDVLAQVASNTDGSKNAGNAVLYEAVRTIFGIQSDSGLRVLGVNILGKFLGTRDNNTRYVALNTLLWVMESEPTAVQRHRATILECLQDSDVSIRRRALDLSFALINEQNVRVMVRELLTFLETADTEFKTNLVSQIAVSAERYAPHVRWHVDTVIRALKLAGSHAKENVLSAFITLVINADAETQLYTAQKLYSALRQDITQQGLTVVGVWLIGEYGQMLLKGGNFTDNDKEVVVTESEIVSLLDSILESSYATEIVREYVVNALMKLSTRFTVQSEVERVRRILDSKAKSLDIEVQQRAVEYGKLFGFDSVRKGVLEKMPPPEIREDLGKRYEAERNKNKLNKRGNTIKKTTNTSTTTTLGGAASVDLLLDLADDTTPTSNNNGGGGSSNNQGSSSADLLSDIFGSSSGVAASSQPQQQNPLSSIQDQQPKSSQNILDLFDSAPKSSPTAPPASSAANTPQQSTTDLLGGGDISSGGPAETESQEPSQFESIQAYSNNGLNIHLHPQKNDTPGQATVIARFANTSLSSTISDLVLQVAVPKSQKLQLQSLSSSTLAPNATATQNMKVSGNPGAIVKLRLRISYKLDENEIKDQVDFNSFPSNLL